MKATLIYTSVLAPMAVQGMRAAASGPVDPDTAKDCTYFLNASDASENCAWMEDQAGISHKDFVSWNPSVKDDCSGLKIGNDYCVEVNYGITTTSTTLKPTTTTTSPKATTTTTGPPSPTQDGLTKDCKVFYFAKAGDTCDGIVKSYGTFTLQDFVKWNPAVGDDCSGLWAKTYYCVGVSGTPTKPITTTTTTSTTTTGTAPHPTQDGMDPTCKKVYQAKSGDNCQKIADLYKTFTVSDFIRWNPAVGDTCANLLAGYDYCVDGSKGPTTTKPSNGVETPAPVQDGMVDYCSKFYKVNSGDGCYNIAKSKSIDLDDLYRWNPAVKNDCSGLQANTYICVGVIGFHVQSRYDRNCGGSTHNNNIVSMNEDGPCINTDCSVGSLDVASIGACPDGQVQVSYWEQPNCQGKWFGYGYGSRGTCKSLWTFGYKFKSLHLRCAKQSDDCVSRGSCKEDPEPSNNLC